MEPTIESSIVFLAMFTFLIGLVVGIFLTKFADMWKPSNVTQKPK